MKTKVEQKSFLLYLDTQGHSIQEQVRVLQMTKKEL